ncbi:MAG: glycosyltransferase family 2 protein [Pedobacter sp.]|nr:MAG: glycosyltransferase family 2 protein [Pedobacter sp.]
MKSKIILVPTYNASATIRETLNSIQASIGKQSLIEKVYIADDFSTDDTLDICLATWTHQTEMTILTATKNRGERENINAAVKLLKDRYEWLLILHADDIAKENWVSTMCEAIDQGDENLASVCSSYDVLWEDGSIEPGEDKEKNILVKGDDETIRNTLRKGTWWHISGCAISIKALEDSGGFHSQMPQYGDMEWLLRILQKKLVVQYIPRSLTLYRQASTSVSSKSFRKHRDIYEHANLVIGYRNFLSKTDLRELFFRFYIQLSKRIGSSILKGDLSRLISSIKMMLYLAKLFLITQKPNIPYINQQLS